MAVVTIGHHPELTPAKAFDIFKVQFGDRYSVYLSKNRRWQFCIEKDSRTAVGVRLEQKRDRTKFVFMGFAPAWYGALINPMFGPGAGGLPALLWGNLTNEVETFIREAPEFH